MSSVKFLINLIWRLLYEFNSKLIIIVNLAIFTWFTFKQILMSVFKFKSLFFSFHTTIRFILYLHNSILNIFIIHNVMVYLSRFFFFLNLQPTGKFPEWPNPPLRYTVTLYFIILALYVLLGYVLLLPVHRHMNF